MNTGKSDTGSREAGAQAFRGRVLSRLDRARQQLYAAAIELDDLLDGRFGEMPGGTGAYGRLAAESAAAGAADPASTLIALVRQVHAFCERDHFPVEDALLELVVELGITPAERRALFVNLAQHQDLHAAALGVVGQCPAPAAPDGDARKSGARTAAAANASPVKENAVKAGAGTASALAIRESGGHYVVQLRRHLDFEAAFIEPLLWHYLSASVLEGLERRDPQLFAVLSLPPGSDLHSWPGSSVVRPS